MLDTHVVSMARGSVGVGSPPIEGDLLRSFVDRMRKAKTAKRVQWADQQGFSIGRQKQLEEVFYVEGLGSTTGEQE